MTRLRPLFLVGTVTLAGALGTLAVGSIMGMKGGEIAHLLLFLLPAASATVVATAVAQPTLAHASIRSRLIAIAAIAALVSLANLVVLTRLMFVEPHDAAQVRVLLLYSVGSGVGVALALARSTRASVDQLVEVARRLSGGDLAARVEQPPAEPELALMARTLDEMAERLQQSLEQERASESMRRELLTAVSHDLRTPLSSLKAMLEAIDDGVVNDLEGVRRYNAHMRDAVESLITLVDDLFELVQLDAGVLESETAQQTVAEILHGALKACDIQALEKGLELVVDLGNAGSSLSSPRLVRVVQNLLQNAIAHTPERGEVRIAAQRFDGRLEVTVSDTGTGIPSHQLERVFEPFWRGDPAREAPGSGLGLAVAAKIVGRLGGTIHAESVFGSGSTFRAVIPVESVDVATIPKDAVRGAGSSSV